MSNKTSDSELTEKQLEELLQEFTNLHNNQVLFICKWDLETADYRFSAITKPYGCISNAVLACFLRERADEIEAREPSSSTSTPPSNKKIWN